MIEKRHTVRKYLDKPLDVDLISLGLTSNLVTLL